MRHERPGRGAAVQRLQHRRLDLEESAALESVAQLTHDGNPLAGVLPGLRPDDEIDVALTHPSLFAHLLVRDRAADAAPSTPSATSRP